MLTDSYSSDLAVVVDGVAATSVGIPGSICVDLMSVVFGFDVNRIAVVLKIANYDAVVSAVRVGVVVAVEHLVSSSRRWSGKRS